MNGAFTESKFWQILTFISDLVILNLLFLLCCLPIVTIGASQAGLYTGVRVLLDKEDDTSCTKAFFRGFRSGFLRITVSSCLYLVLAALLVAAMIAMISYQQSGVEAPLWIAMAALSLCLLQQSLLPLFHSRFDCKFSQLLRNVCITALGNPLRTLLTAVLTWLPVGVALLFPYVFLKITVVWLALYYSLAAMAGTLLFHKPFRKIEESLDEEVPAEAEAEA